MAVRSRPEIVAVGGLAAFVALVVAQHLTRAGDLPPADHFVSEYAVGPGGWVQVVAFLAWALSLAATARLLAGHVIPGRGVARALALGGVSAGKQARVMPRRRVARALALGGVAAGALGAVLCAFFATQTIGGELPPEVTRTTAGQLHDLGSAGIFFGLLIAALAALRLFPARRYRRGVLALAALMILIPGGLIAAGFDAPGWGQRGFIAVGCLWQVLAISSSEVE